MYKKSLTHYISKIVVDVLFYCSILCTVLVPFTASKLFGWIDYPNQSYLVAFTAVIFVSGLGCTYILFNLKVMFLSLLSGNPFTDENVGHFRKIAVTCFVMTVIYAVKCFVLFTVATLVIAVIFMVGTLFCLTLKDLFKQAINYKTENELTI